METETDLPYADSLSKWQQYLGLGQAEAKHLKLHRSLPRGTLAVSGILAGSWRNRIARTGTSVLIEDASITDGYLACYATTLVPTVRAPSCILQTSFYQ